MWKFIVRRILIMMPQLILLSIIVFVLAKFMPGDALTGEIDPNIDPKRMEQLREELGWNDPWYEQVPADGFQELSKAISANHSDINCPSPN